MLNGAYITTHSVYNESFIRKNSGVVNKILSQYKILQNNFNMRMDIYDDIKGGLIFQILRRLPFFPISTSWKIIKNYSRINFLYIRMGVIDSYFIKFLQKVRKQNKDIVILAELPTYPYDAELGSLKNYPILLKNRYSRKKLFPYIDKIVTFSLDEIIFGINTIKIINGIDTAVIPPVSIKKQDDIIYLIAVSNMAFWHGYDRLIRGMANYYTNGGSRKIHVHLVGDGESIGHCRKLIKDNNLENYIFLHGFQKGEALDDIYQYADIAVASLGGHRKKLHLSSELKSREYLARGLPIIASTKIDVLPENFQYCLYVPEDDSPIDINSVIVFYDYITNLEDRDKTVNKLRQFAREKCDMSITMKPVIDYIIANIVA